VFIEVALSRGIIKTIHEVIDKAVEDRDNSKGNPDTAIFYSINNTQNGLAGLGLGKVLIFQVVDALKRDHPGIRTFSTLSPITGFSERYLKRILQGDDGNFSMKQEKLLTYFPEKVQQALAGRYEENTGTPPADFAACLLSILSDPTWIEDPVYTQHLKKPLTEIGYYYIAQEKNRQGKPLNPVANFHMGNGATVGLSNVHFGGNRFPRGVKESCSLMVNYVYSRSWLQEFSKTMQAWLPWT
jgi:malonyl-CoA decarboxylase